MRYLSNKQDLGLSYTSDRNNGLEVYTDADLGGDDLTSRSTTGSVVLYGGAPIFWRSSRQSIVTTSSTEAEIVSLESTVKDIIRLFNLAIELGIIKPKPITIFCDNESAIHLVSNERSVHRTKHLKLKQAFIREQINLKQIKVLHV